MRVFCPQTSSSSRPRIASTSIVRRKRVLTSNDIQAGPMVHKKYDARSGTQTSAYFGHALQTMKTAARMRTAKIMVSAAFTNWGKLETRMGSRTTRGASSHCDGARQKADRRVTV